LTATQNMARQLRSAGSARYALETQTDADVVHDRDVGVSRGECELAFLPRPGPFAHGRDNDEERLDLDVFCCQLPLQSAQMTHGGRRA
jgi:hypothetical protein